MLRCDANRGSSSPAASLSRRFLAPTCQGKRKTITINNHSKWLSNSFLTFREHDLDPPKTDSCLSDFFSKSWNRGRYRIQWPASGCAGNDVRWTGIAGEWFAKMFRQETSSNFWIRESGSCNEWIQEGLKLGWSMLEASCFFGSCRLFVPGLSRWLDVGVHNLGVLVTDRSWTVCSIYVP